MSAFDEPELNFDDAESLDVWQQELKQISLPATRVDRDQLMYDCGHAAARAANQKGVQLALQRRARWATGVATISAMACLWMTLTVLWSPPPQRGVTQLSPGQRSSAERMVQSDPRQAKEEETPETSPRWEPEIRDPSNSPLVLLDQLTHDPQEIPLGVWPSMQGVRRAPKTGRLPPPGAYEGLGQQQLLRRMLEDATGVLP